MVTFLNLFFIFLFYTLFVRRFITLFSTNRYKFISETPFMSFNCIFIDLYIFKHQYNTLILYYLYLINTHNISIKFIL